MGEILSNRTVRVYQSTNSVVHEVQYQRPLIDPEILHQSHSHHLELQQIVNCTDQLSIAGSSLAKTVLYVTQYIVRF